MSKLRPKRGQIEIGGVKYTLCFTLGVMAELEDHLTENMQGADDSGEINVDAFYLVKKGLGKGNVSALIVLCKAMLNAGIDVENEKANEGKKKEHFSETQIRGLPASRLVDIKNAVIDTVNNALSSDAPEEASLVKNEEATAKE